MATKSQELKQANDELVYWENIAKPIGWNVYGWTYRNYATFIGPEGHLVQVDNKILKLIDSARKHPYVTSDLS